MHSVVEKEKTFTRLGIGELAGRVKASSSTRDHASGRASFFAAEIG
jgi:hypothetical protein